MAQVQSPDPTRKLQRRYNLVASELSSTFVSPEILPVALVDDLTQIDPADEAFQRRATALGNNVPGAGEFAVTALRNPPNSGVLLVTQSVLLRIPTGGADTELRLDFSSADTVIDRAGGFRDGRIDGTPVGGLRIASAVAQPSVEVSNMDADLGEPGRFQDLEWVIQPAQQLRFKMRTADQSFFLVINWIERTLGSG